MFDGKYLEWNQKKIKAIIDHYGVDFFKGKRILDLGCGHGDIGAAFFRLGAEVTSVDARDDHLKIVKKKHHGLKLLQIDLDKDWQFKQQQFDLIIDLGLLCHLKNYEKHLKDICYSANHLVLETAVCDSQDPHKVFTYSENKGIYDWSFNGFGNRASPAAIERVLKDNGMDYLRIDNKKLNAGNFKYDWISNNHNGHSNEQRRFWFATKNQEAAAIVRRNFSKPQPIINTGIPANASPPILSPQLSISDQLSNFKNTSINNLAFHKAGQLKVAVCISGFLRSFEQTFESLFVNLTDQFNCDFFIHTWDMVGSFERHFDNKVSNISTRNIENRIRDIYNPKQLIIEPKKHFHITDMIRYKAFGRDPNAVLSMYYKIQECNKLKSSYEFQNNFKYDLVVRYRSDMLIQSKIIIDPTLDLTQMYIPSQGDFGGINDQFAFSNSANMDIYSSLFNKINQYLNENQILNPELLLKYHLEINQFSLKRFNCNYVLNRPDGSFQDNGLLERRLSFIK